MTLRQAGRLISPLNEQNIIRIMEKSLGFNRPKKLSSFFC
jgi:hypothetical protein